MDWLLVLLASAAHAGALVAPPRLAHLTSAPRLRLRLPTTPATMPARAAMALHASTVRRGAGTALMSLEPGAAPSEPGGGGKKNENPLLLRLLLLAATSTAAVLARTLRPLNAFLRTLETVLRDLARQGSQRRIVRFLFALSTMLLFSSFLASLRGVPKPMPIELGYSSFLRLVETGAPIEALTVSLKRLDFLIDGRAHFARPVYAAPSLLGLLATKGVEFSAAMPGRFEGGSTLILAMIWILGLGFIQMRQQRSMSGGVGKRASAGSLGAPLSFEDVQGIANAKNEVVEIVQMLKNPKKYQSAGVRLPSGILLAGPPGTGKTLLARVLAAEAGVPFFFCSGSDFVEIFVGRGASRLRALFVKAAKIAPCVVFIDELDALGKRRSLRLAGSNDEAEQTLNQLLACMDGLDSSNNGVIVVGATNRASLLDPALIRPGRFDRIVQIDLPDTRGRAEILAVHTRALELAADVNVGRVAELVPGLSGAELAAICNEAAIRMVRRSGTRICQADFESAIRDYTKSRQLAPTSLIDKILLGQP